MFLADSMQVTCIAPGFSGSEFKVSQRKPALLKTSDDSGIPWGNLHSLERPDLGSTSGTGCGIVRVSATFQEMRAADR